MTGEAGWEPVYDRGTGIYETRHEPPRFVFYAEDEHGRRRLRSAAHSTREAAQAQMDEHEEFHRKFWAERAEKVKTNPKACAIDGHVYQVGEEHPYRAPELLGFGGRQFFIARHDGTLIETRNLWYSGEIPSAWRERIPDNAEFVNGERWIQLGGVSYLDSSGGAR